MKTTTVSAIAFVASMIAASPAHAEHPAFDAWTITSDCNRVARYLGVNEETGATGYFGVVQNGTASFLLVPFNGVSEQTLKTPRKFITDTVYGQQAVVMMTATPQGVVFTFGKDDAKRIVANLEAGRDFKIGSKLFTAPAQGFKQANEYARKTCKEWSF